MQHSASPQVSDLTQQLHVTASGFDSRHLHPCDLRKRRSRRRWR